MKHDLNLLETDEGVKLPPYVSRSTAPPPRMIDDPAMMAVRELFAKHEFSMMFNNQKVSAT